MSQGFVRIIGGKWRGRRLKVPVIKGLRPTPDRVRETLFNWLAPHIQGTHCLDLFAGSGALGFEALSRGARAVVMVDQSAEVVALLQAEFAALGSGEAHFYLARIPLQLPAVSHPFDIVFLDPPYQEQLLLTCCRTLEEQGYLAELAYIYLEAEVLIKDNELPMHWRIVKSKQAGSVFYHLAERKRVKSS